MLNISLVAYTYLSRIRPNFLNFFLLLLNCYFVIHNIEMYFPAMKVFEYSELFFDPYWNHIS